LLVACTREPASSGSERFAILRFENTGSDLSADWQGRALAEVLSQQIGAIATSRLHSFDRTLGAHAVSAPGISSESTLAMAAGATRIGYGEFWERNGKLEARLTIEDSQRLKVLKVVEASAQAGDVLGVAGALARQISSKVTPYGTSGAQALMHYVKGIESPGGTGTERELEQAVAADPAFAAPYTPLAQAKVRRGDRPGALAVLEQAMTRPGMAESARVRFEAGVAELRGDAGARINALAKLGGLEPNDESVWRELAQLAMVRHEYAPARQAIEKALALAPEDTDLLNILGYSAAQSGDLKAGVAALERYRALRPKEANPLDSLGDVQLVVGNLAEAEKLYLEAQKIDRAFLSDGDLIKAAMARLLSGDVSGADKLAEDFFQARKQANDPTLEYRRAMWNWIAGRRRAAMRQMETFARAAESTPALRDGVSRAWSDLSVWALELGDRAGATAAAQKSISLATPASAGNAVVARFLALPEAPAAEWSVRANQQFGAPAQAQLRNLALAYALLMNREFAAAQTVLEPMWRNGAALTDEGLPVLLAWCYVETGKLREAEALLRPYPIPPTGGPAVYTSLYLPRLFYLRGVVAEKGGRGEEARKEYRKFLDLSGADPLMWGEEKKAREMVGR
jgi:Flp pilus assembly protein TadD